MPLVSYVIIDEFGNPTGEEVEELYKSTAEAPDELISSEGRVARRQVAMIARTSNSWGDTNMRYDPNLRASYSSIAQRDKICVAKGLTPVDDLPAGTSERFSSREKDYMKHWQKQDEKWDAIKVKHQVYKSDGTVDDAAAGRAWEEYAPAGAVLTEDKHPSTLLDIKDF